MIYHLWKYEWKRMLKQPALFLFTILFPIIFVGLLAVFLYSVSSDELETVNILVLDDDQTFETKALINQLQDDDTIEGDVKLSEGQYDLSYYIEKPGSYAAIVQIPEGFTEQLRSGVNETINVYLNEKLPLASNLSYLLLESGQAYISSAQTGVNTVNHFHTRNIDDSSERQQFLQQSIIHFTTYSLGRNSFFEQVETTEQILSWLRHIFIVLVVSLIFLTYWLQLILFQPKHQPIMQARLRLINVTRIDQLLANWLCQLTFIVGYSIAIAYGLSYILFNSVQLDPLLLVQWVSIAILISMLHVIIRIIISNFILSLLIFTISGLCLIFMSGLIIPPVYLGTLGFLTFIYDAFVKVWLHSEIPVNFWTGVGIMFLLTLLAIIIIRKIGVMAK
ncbi:ABC transporter permease [Piscibacillus sp. B03]|uniref:ABC transporter permease n=1 Tax=Piscibacillus sp. B03 TaxID=3457430 RepID=UPI003FCDB654